MANIKVNKSKISKNTTDYGFNIDLLTKTAKQASEEALNVYHYGHYPTIVEHEHKANGECTPACTASYMLQEAASHIKLLEAVPDAISKILTEYDGFNIVPALTDYIEQIRNKKLTLKDGFDFVHNNAPENCTCYDCKNGKTKKKFGLDITSENNSVSSVSSLDEALAGSVVTVWKTEKYRKFPNGKWGHSNSKIGDLVSADFTGVIHQNNIIWFKHLVSAETSQKEESSNTNDNSFIVIGNEIESNNQMNLAPIGTIIHNSENYDKVGYKKFDNGKWAAQSASSGLHSPDAFNLGHNSNKWVWGSKEQVKAHAKPEVYEDDDF